MTATFTLTYLCGHEYVAVFETGDYSRYPKVNSSKADFTCGIQACKTLDKGTYKLSYDLQTMVWYCKPMYLHALSPNMAVNILNSVSDKDSFEPHALERGALNLTNPCNLPVLFSLVPAHEQEG